MFLARVKILADSKTPFNLGQHGIFPCVSVDIPQFRQIGPVHAEPNVTGAAKRTSLYDFTHDIQCNLGKASSIFSLPHKMPVSGVSWRASRGKPEKPLLSDVKAAPKTSARNGMKRNPKACRTAEPTSCSFITSHNSPAHVELPGNSLQPKSFDQSTKS